MHVFANVRIQGMGTCRSYTTFLLNKMYIITMYTVCSTWAHLGGFRFKPSLNVSVPLLKPKTHRI